MLLLSNLGLLTLSKEKEGAGDTRSKGIQTSMEEAEEEESKLPTNVNKPETNRHADNPSLIHPRVVKLEKRNSRRCRPGDSLLSTAAGCLEKSFRARAMQPSRRVRDSNERHTLGGARTYV